MSEEVKAKFLNQMRVAVEGDELVVRLPINKELIDGKSGKTLQVASSHGNQICQLTINGRAEAVFVGLNAYISKKGRQP